MHSMDALREKSNENSRCLDSVSQVINGSLFECFSSHKKFLSSINAIEFFKNSNFVYENQKKGKINEHFKKMTCIRLLIRDN